MDAFLNFMTTDTTIFGISLHNGMLVLAGVACALDSDNSAGPIRIRTWRQARAPDPAGENYWVTQLQTGASTVGGAIINIISGAQNNDLVTINNKVAVGDYFDTQIYSHSVAFSDLGQRWPH